MSLTPQKLCVYYSWLNSVNGTYSVAGAVNVFKDYDQLVIGAGIEEPTHGDYANTVAILGDPLMANTEVYGYIDATLPLNTIQEKIDKIYNLPNISGIFVDQMGFDYGVSREKQREIVWCIHEKGDNTLKVFANAWNCDDLFSPAVNPTHNPNGLPTRLGANDLYLAESFAVINGTYDDADSDANNIKDWQDKAAKMVAYRTTFGTKMTAIATNGNGAFDQAKADYSYYASVLNGFDSWGYGEDLYSAVSAQLPMRSRKIFYGDRFDSAVTITGNVYERRTNVGIHLDTSAHSVDILLA